MICCSLLCHQSISRLYKKVAPPRMLALFIFAVVSLLYFIQINSKCKMKQYPTAPSPPMHISNLFSQDKFVRNCVTGNTIGILPDHPRSKPITLMNISVLETSDDRSKSFISIFKNKYWAANGNPEYSGLTASGSGSSIYFAQETVAALHRIISQLKTHLGKSVIRFLDIPCGDMVWMHRFLQTRDDIEYTGVDIVPDLINQHREKFKNTNWTFKHEDILHSKIDEYDLILSRHVLQHLSTDDVQTLLMKYSYSGSHYLFTSMHMTAWENKELDRKGARFRPINLELPPYYLAPAVCLTPEGPLPRPAGQFMNLYKLPLHQLEACEHINSFVVKGTSTTVFSCANWGKHSL